MSFMQREITERIKWFEIGAADVPNVPAIVTSHFSTHHGNLSHSDCQVCDVEGGSKTVPAFLSDYTENSEAWEVTIRFGFGARLSAPGYLDCTEWNVFDSVEDAEEYLEENYPEEEEEEENSEPAESDYVIAPCGPLGSRCAVSEHGVRFLQEFSSQDDALAFIRARMEEEKFWPNVWKISDHGNRIEPIDMALAK